MTHNEEKIQELEKLLQNYEELASDIDCDDAFVARGNGFCDTKYSQDFIDGQIQKIKQQINDLSQKSLHDTPKTKIGQ